MKRTTSSKTAPRRPGRSSSRRTGAIAAIAAGVLVLAAVLWIWRPFGTLSPADGPILIFSIDTLRADRLPAYGYTKTRTPHIDRFVADGVLFENAYSHSPQTLPAHTSILSGELPFEHGVRDNIGFPVRPGQRFLQHALQELGVATAGFVSAYVLRHQTGFSQGFDHYDDELPAASPELPLGQVQRSGTDTVAAAARWIEQQTSPKFFVFLHIYEPHRPYTPPARFPAADAYDGEVEHSDEIFGELLEHLRAKDLYDRATIILLADHGEGLGDHGEEEHGIFLYRETIHIPLVVKLPGSRGAGRRVSALAQQIDVVPTVLDLVGAAVPDDLRGRSLRPVLEGNGSLEKASIYSEALTSRYHFGWSELYALADGPYRLIRAPRDELYDISQDPGERVSIVDARPQVHAAMRRTLEAFIAGVSIDAPSAVSEADRRKLAALGYVGTQTSARATSALPGDELPDPKDKIAVLRTYKRAVDLAGERRFADAAALFRELLREDPQMTDVWLQLAGVYERRGMFAEAVAAYKEVVQRNPKDMASLTGVATGLMQLGNLDEARAHAELAIDVAPAVAHEILARIALERGDAETARREAGRAHAADPTLPMPAVVEGLLSYRHGRYAAAVQHLVEARAQLSGRTVQMPEVNYHIADSLARLERYGEAEPYFTAELALFPGNLRARAGLAMLYRAMGRHAEAEKAIADLIRNSPTPAGYDLAAQLWAMFGEPERAAAARAEAVRTRVDSAVK